MRLGTPDGGRDDGLKAMPPRSPRDRDPLEADIEASLRPGAFVHWRGADDLVEELERVAARIVALAKSDAPRAAALFEIFLAGCYEKADAVHDSGNVYGTFVEDLHALWIRARVAARADPMETADRILRWVDEDPYGYCHSMEKRFAESLDRKGLAAFESRVRERFEAAGAPIGGGSPANPRRDYDRRRWGDFLRAIHERRGDVDAYVALCGLVSPSPDDCERLARILRRKHRPEEALAWVDRGLALTGEDALDRAGAGDLTALRLTLLQDLGRGEEALHAAWAEFVALPASFTYAALMRFVPKAERKAWRGKAVEAASLADSLYAAVDFLLEMKATGLVTRRLEAASARDLEDLPEHIAEAAAVKVERARPELAARLYRQLALRILVRKSSRSYDLALGYLENVRTCYRRAGQVPAWEALVAEIRRDHARKYAFMPGFEQLLAGSGPGRTPTFLEQARRRWLATKGGAPGAEEE